MNAAAAKPAPAVEYQKLGIDESEALFLDYYEHQFAYTIELQREIEELEEEPASN
jgi:hypothetical protein